MAKLRSDCFSHSFLPVRANSFGSVRQYSTFYCLRGVIGKSIKALKLAAVDLECYSDVEDVVVAEHICIHQIRSIGKYKGKIMPCNSLPVLISCTLSILSLCTSSMHMTIYYLYLVLHSILLLYIWQYISCISSLLSFCTEPLYAIIFILFT